MISRLLALSVALFLVACSDGPPPFETTRLDGKLNAEQGKAFLASNGQQTMVITTASGLQYQMLRQGTGRKPGPHDTVTVNYRGTLLTGEEFDSSKAHGKPAIFQVDGLIPGWSEGLQLMNEGSAYRFFIPAELAYGAQGAGKSIGPNETLIFDVELLFVHQ